MIHIQFEGHSAEQIRKEMLALLGSTVMTATEPAPLVFDKAAFLGEQQETNSSTAAEQRRTFVIPEGFEAVRDWEGRATGEVRPIAETAFKPTGAAAPTRERGKPSPGRARRTKAEIAEDEAADKADALAAGANQTAGISTGEERVGPEDSAEDAQQDAADEAAETAAAKAAMGGKLTLDDVRNALGVYVQKFGMEAAQTDGPKVLKMVCGDAVTKISAIPDDQAIIAKVVAGIEEMTAKNPFKHQAKAA